MCCRLLAHLRILPNRTSLIYALCTRFCPLLSLTGPRQERDAERNRIREKYGLKGASQPAPEPEPEEPEKKKDCSVM